MVDKKRGRPKGSRNKDKNVDRQTKEGKVRLRDEIWAIIIMALGIFLIISLQTDATGGLGHVISNLFKGLFAIVTFALPYCLVLYGLLVLFKKTAHIDWKALLLLLTIFLMAAVINSARFLDDQGLALSFAFIKSSFFNGIKLEGGGAFGMLIGLVLKKAVGIPGLYIFASVAILVSLMVLINNPISYYMQKVKLAVNTRDKEEIEKSTTNEDRGEAAKVSGLKSVNAISPRQMKIIDYMKDEALFEGSEKSQGKGLEKPSRVEAGKGLEEEKKSKPADKQVIEDLEIEIDKAPINYTMPTEDLLTKARASHSGKENIDLKEKAVKLEETLKNFGVNAKIIQVTKGPAITRYEIQPDVGVKVSSIVRLADDIALNLEAKSIRMEAPIPGKAAVGIEVENERINLVTIRELIESAEFKKSKSKITFAVGKDIAGTPIVADLKTMPHLLIAGSTGSGKSVCLNSIIISILYKARPEEVKLVLIDPKVVELGNYNGIPHLLIPVVTEASKSAAALGWAVSEMTDRYRKFAEAGVRDLGSYNAYIKDKEGKESMLPQIVIVIDELADLMMVAPSQVEESICRLAQMARAAGMHLIVATQRPSVDIITGVIKANIPSRIAFAVSSQFDSRTILDMSGAEKLMGKGDMLFNPLGKSKALRVQGCFISDSEVHRVIDYLKEQMPDNKYAEDVIKKIDHTYKNETEDDGDELLPEAIETVVRAEQASVSMLQRRFRIGYNRAARLVDMMEDRGIIGPSEGSRPRKVLMTEEEFLNLGKDIDEEN